MHFTQSAARFELLSVENGKKVQKFPKQTEHLESSAKIP